MVNSLRQSGADKIIPTLTIDHPFYWNWKPQGADGATENFYCGGDRERDLLSFLDSFRKVRAKPGSYWSFCFHCSSAHPEGDVLRHMKRFFENQPLLEPLKKKIDGYIKHIATLNNDSSGIAQKAKLTLEIIDYVDRVIRALIEKDKDFYEGVTIIRNQQKPAAQSSMVPLKVISQISAAA
jgi:hypothetical protein